MEKKLLIEADGLKMDMCRFCLSKDAQLAHVYSASKTLGCTIAEAAMECTTVEISLNDGMPLYVCKTCYLKLQDVHQFKKMVLKSDAVLKTYIRQLRFKKSTISRNYPAKDEPLGFDETQCTDQSRDDDIMTEDKEIDRGSDNINTSFEKQAFIITPKDENLSADNFSSRSNLTSNSPEESLEKRDNLPSNDSIEQIISTNSANHSLEMQIDEPLAITDITHRNLLDSKSNVQEISGNALSDHNSDSAVEMEERNDFDDWYSVEGSKNHNSELESDNDGNTDLNRKKICTTSDKTKNKLRKSVLTNNANANLQCEICRNRFARKDGLRRHLKNIHRLNKQEISNILGKKTSSKENDDSMNSKSTEKLTSTSSTDQSLETQSEVSLEKTNHEDISDANKRKDQENSGNSMTDHISENVEMEATNSSIEDDFDDRQSDEVGSKEDNSENESNDHETSRNSSDNSSVSDHTDDWVLEEDSTSETEEDFGSSDDSAENKLKNNKKNNLKRKISDETFSRKRVLRRHTKRTPNEQESSDTFNKINSSKENENLLISNAVEKLISANLDVQTNEPLENSNIADLDILNTNKRSDQEKSRYSSNDNTLDNAVERDDVDALHSEEVGSKDDNSEKESEKNINPSLKCKICQKFFSWKGNLRRHILRVHNKMHFKCQMCEKSFARKDGLNRHVKKIHGSAEQSINENKSTSNKQETSSKLEKMNSSKKNHDSVNNKSVGQSLNMQGKESLEKTDQENISDVNKRKDDFDNWRSEEVGSKEDSSYENKRIKFKCEICKLSFTHKSNFRRHHLEKHESNLTRHEFKCEKCEKNFARKDHLRKHMARIHESNKNENEIRIYSCNTCNEKFLKYREYHSHEVRHFDKTYEPGNPVRCNVCGKSFDTLSKLKLHIKRHDDDDRPFQCTKCDKKFKTKYNLASHQRVHGDTKLWSICPICGKAVKSNISQHIRCHSNSKNFMCQKCGKKFKTLFFLKRHKEIHDGEMMECKICNKSFKGKTLLNAHIKNCHHGKEFKCNICFKISSSKQTLKSHIKGVHEKKRAFDCSECKKTFSSPVGLMLHKKSAHSRTKPFECQECGKCFTRKDFLVMHLRMHSGEKPYKCDECDKRFSRNDNLKIHLKKVHGKSMKYKCQVCDKKFRMKRKLDNHIEVRHNVPTQKP